MGGLKCGVMQFDIGLGLIELHGLGRGMRSTYYMLETITREKNRSKYMILQLKSDFESVACR